MSSLKPDQLDAQIRQGTLGSLYLFDGPENWLKEKALNQILDRYLPPEARDFNFDRFSGSEHTGADVVASALSVPFLAEKRIVLVRSTEEFAAADARVISEHLGSLPSSTCLIFLYQGKSSLKEEIPAQAASYGALVTFWTPFKEQLPEWILKEGRARGKTISRDVALALTDVCENLEQISQEIDKLILFVGKKPAIQLEDLKAFGLPNEAGDFRGLETALLNRDLKDALRQAHLLSEEGARPEMMMPVIERSFRSLVLGHFYQREKGWPLKDIYTALGQRGITQQNHFSRGLKSYRPEEAQAAFSKMAAADYDVKTGALPGEISLSLLILGLLQR